ncbi:unnamed protein product [Colias eurytheme]|nr:unnamed protein product [Colias eurytheme]
MRVRAQRQHGADWWRGGRGAPRAGAGEGRPRPAPPAGRPAPRPCAAPRALRPTPCPAPHTAPLAARPAPPRFTRRRSHRHLIIYKHYDYSYDLQAALSGLNVLRALITDNYDNFTADAFNL